MLLLTYMDNVDVEYLGYIINKLIEAGASNVHAIPSFTKKGRQGFVFLIDVEDDKIQSVENILASEAGVLGYRVIECIHKSFKYDIVKVKVYVGGREAGFVRVKRLIANGEVRSVKAEYDDVVKIVEKHAGAPGARSLKSMVEAAVLNNVFEVKI